MVIDTNRARSLSVRSVQYQYLVGWLLWMDENWLNDWYYEKVGVMTTHAPCDFLYFINLHDERRWMDVMMMLDYARWTCSVHVLRAFCMARAWFMACACHWWPPTARGIAFMWHAQQLTKILDYNGKWKRNDEGVQRRSRPHQAPRCKQSSSNKAKWNDNLWFDLHKKQGHCIIFSAS